MWWFKGPRDPRRLHWSAIGDEQLKWVTKTLFHVEDAPGLPPFIWMLHSDDACEAILEVLRECDRWGAIAKGMGNTERPNLFSRRSGQAGLSSGNAAEEEEEEVDREGNGDTEDSSSAPAALVVALPSGRKRGLSQLESLEPAEGAKRRHRMVIASVDG